MGLESLLASDWCEFGRLMGESWACKRRLSEQVSSARLDAAYDAAMDAGAYGGKLLGAGGGGFMLLVVPTDRQSAVAGSLSEMQYVPFHLESGGSRIIFAEDSH
jgi:D-glycero-alpha-D-manno-heptose-7-phosphate kinase